MSTNLCVIQVGSVEALVIRKPIKNLHLSVLPPDGRVRVSAPLHMTDDTIRVMLATKTPWIRKHQRKYEAQERQTPRRYVSGESHYFLGRRYRLQVVHEEKPPHVHLNGKSRIILQVRSGSDLAKREAVMADWYRAELRAVLAELIDKYQERIGVKAASWNVKRMKTRWGTCNHDARRLWFNLELAKKPLEHIEYVVVHELLHLIERRHNKKFSDMLDTYLPKWSSAKEDLNRFILSHEDWSY
jgi:predicted metal-dependent hydrolase